MASLQSTTINGSLSTNTGKIALNSVGGWNDTQALLTVGSGGDGRIQTRHIWGKSASSDATDHLWLQYSNTGQHVQIGNSGGGNNLYVSGDIYAGGYFSGNLVLNSSNYANYTIDNTTAFKHFAWDNLASNATQARRFEIARIGIDPQNWNSTGTFEVELSERYYLNGLKKRYVVWYGYSSPRSGVNLVEMIGYGFNGFRVVIGTEVVINANQYYLPVYVDVRNYSQVSARVITSRLITTNSTPPVNYTYINNNPSPVNISDFAADSTVYISNAASAYTLNAGLTIGLASGTMISSSAMTDMIGWNTSYGAYIGSTVGSTTYIYGNGSFYDGSANRTLLHSANVGTYAFPRSGSWAADLVSSYGFTREHGIQMTGGSEFVVLSKSGQGYLLVDGSYYAAEAGGFYSTNNSSGGTLLGFYADTTTSLNFNTTTVKLNSNQILHAGNYGGYSTFTGSVTSGYGSFSSPGHIVGDAQYGLYVTGGNLYYKSASGGVHYWRNTANSGNPMALDNNGNLTITGALSEGGYTAYPDRVYTINLSAQSTANFYPVVLDASPGEGAIGVWHHRFSVEMPSQGGGVNFNNHTLVAEVRGQGWSDQQLFYRAFHTYYDTSERSILGIWRGTQSWYGVVVYLRGGQTYYVRSNSRSVTGYTSAVTLNSNATFAIKDYTNADVSGTSANISEMLNLFNTPAGFYHSNIIIAPSMYAARFYDNDNSTYYLDPASTSNLNGLTVAGTITGSITGNAATVGGLSVHTGTNNEANKIVRTDANGYIQAGWINTPSGDMSDTSNINRIYCSDDGYIRYKGVADFQQQIGLTYKYATPRSSNTTDTNYWTGIMGWGTTDLNTIFDYGCGFFDTWSNPANQPSGSSHWVGAQAIHYTNGTARYGWQLAVGAGNPSLVYMRGIWGTSFTSWRLFWNDGNDGAGSGLDADLLDGYNSATAATANTIVLRDSAGHITGNYLFGNYVNTSDDVSTGNISYIMAKFGDNYYRSATAAKVAGFISGQNMNIVGNATTVTNGVYTNANNTFTANNTFSNSTIIQGNYYRRYVGAASPSANFGNFKQYLRLWAASGSGANLFTLRITINGDWNYSPIYGILQATYSLYLPGDGTISTNRDFRINQVAGFAGSNLRIGDAVIENGYVSIPFWCINTNPVQITIEQWGGTAVLGTVTTAVSESLPSFIPTAIQGGLSTNDNIIFPNTSNVGLSTADGTALLRLDDTYGNIYLLNNAGGFYVDATSHNFRNASSSNLMVINSSGDVTATRYLVGTYVNTSDNVPTSENITYVMAKFGDNYHRSASAAKVAGFISGQSMNINGSSTSCTGNAATVTNGVYTNIDNVVSGTIRIDNISNSFVNTVATANRSLTIYQNTVNADAYMTFHIGSDYAGYFGLGGAENDLVWGGWSVGNNRYRILHSGNAAFAWNMNQNVRTTDTTTFAGVRAGDGSLSAPSYSFSSDTNTGMYLYGADILGMSAGGVLGFAMSSSSMSTILPYLFVGGMTAWNTTTPGTTKGFLHLGDASSTANSGVGITWGARDSSSGTTAQAGIYVVTDGSYGTKMYFATTNNYGTGAQMAMRIEHTGDVVFSRGNVGVGTSPAYKLDVNGTVHYTTLTASSDVRFKKNVQVINNPLEKLSSIRGVRFEWNEFVNSRRDGYELNKPTFGVIAQELENVFPELVSHWKLSDDCPDARSVNYEKLIPVLIEAIKELNNKNSLLEARILALENKQ